MQFVLKHSENDGGLQLRFFLVKSPLFPTRMFFMYVNKVSLAASSGFLPFLAFIHM